MNDVNRSWTWHVGKFSACTYCCIPSMMPNIYLHNSRRIPFASCLFKKAFVGQTKEKLSTKFVLLLLGFWSFLLFLKEKFMAINKDKSMWHIIHVILNVYILFMSDIDLRVKRKGFFDREDTFHCNMCRPCRNLVVWCPFCVTCLALR